MRAGRSQLRAFSLLEVIVATLCLGLCLAPFLAYTSRLPEMQRALALQARDDAWRSFQDHAVLNGIDAGGAPGFAPVSNGNVPGLPAREVERTPLAPVAGMTGLRSLQVRSDAWNARGWIRGAGLELSAGPALEPITVPSAPLPPVTLRAPALSPDPSDPVSALSLEKPQSGASGLLKVASVSPDNGTVVLVYGASSLEVRAVREAAFEVGAEVFEAAFSGRTWAEYAGDLAAGDSSVSLPDGRKRWIVREGDRTRVYNPSEVVSYSYHLDLGAPALYYGTLEYASGSPLSFSYASVLGVRSGASVFRVGLPSAVRERLGSAAGRLCLSYETSFAGWSAPADGDLRLFCDEEQQDRWLDAFSVETAPFVASGCLSAPGRWTISRQLTELAEPELLSNVADYGGAFSGEAVRFGAPLHTDGVRRGRLSAREGALVSTSSELSLFLTP